MKKELVAILVFTISFFLFVGFASASFKYNNESLVKNYVGGEKLKGYINLSFTGENADSIFRSNFDDDGTKLIDLLESSGFVKGQHFNCNNEECQNLFKTQAESSSISLSSNDEEYIGFRLTGKNVEVVDASFKINTDSMASCSPGFSISVLGNDSAKIQGNSYNDLPCGSKLTGCFDNTVEDYDLAIVGTTPYCQKMELPSSPAFRLGAEIKNSSTSGKLTMRLFNEGWESIGNCNLPKNTQEIQDLSCIVNFTNIEDRSYYVCIETDNSQSNYQIESEVEGEICGNSDVDFQEYARDYNIFAQPLQYNPSNITVNSDSLEESIGQNLVDYINEYVQEKYLGNCEDECVIPFKIDSQIDQTISISNVNFRYESSGATLTNNKIYSLEEEKAEIDSKGLKINLDYSNIYLPISSSNNELQLYLDDKPIFSKKIKLNFTSGFSFDISPKIASFASPTNFFIISNQNISYSKWNFGDGQIKETTGGFITYSYLKKGDFNITVEATNSKNIKSAKIFKVTVGNVSQSIESLINQSENKIASLSKSIENFEPWIKNEILALNNISEYKLIIADIEKSYNTNYNENDTTYYVSQLYSLDIPKSINYTNTGVLPLDVGFNLINSDYTFALASKDCTGTEEDSYCEDYSWVDKDKVNDYLIYWNPENFNSDVEYKTISEYGLEGANPIFTYFNIKIKQKQASSETKYLIVPYPAESFKFKSEEGIIKLEDNSDGFAIPIDGDENIEFLVTGEMSPADLGAFISPSMDFIVNELKIEPSCKDNPDLPQCEKRSGFWFYFILIVGFLVLYLVLQEWYKKRYEGHLFPNRDDLYNIINYIHNSRASGMTDEQIMKGLTDMKWKGEQITYAFNKIDGKRTGMWEIPIFKFFENRKVRKEIDKRNEKSPQNSTNGGNVRFFNGLK